MYLCLKLVIKNQNCLYVHDEWHGILNEATMSYNELLFTLQHLFLISDTWPSAQPSEDACETVFIKTLRCFGLF